MGKEVEATIAEMSGKNFLDKFNKIASGKKTWGFPASSLGSDATRGRSTNSDFRGSPTQIVVTQSLKNHERVNLAVTSERVIGKPVNGSLIGETRHCLCVADPANG